MFFVHTDWLTWEWWASTINLWEAKVTKSLINNLIFNHFPWFTMNPLRWRNKQRRDGRWFKYLLRAHKKNCHFALTAVYNLLTWLILIFVFFNLNIDDLLRLIQYAESQLKNGRDTYAILAKLLNDMKKLLNQWAPKWRHNFHFRRCL